jgi:hypothetical protein
MTSLRPDRAALDGSLVLAVGPKSIRTLRPFFLAIPARTPLSAELSVKLSTSAKHHHLSRTIRITLPLPHLRALETLALDLSPLSPFLHDYPTRPPRTLSNAISRSSPSPHSPTLPTSHGPSTWHCTLHYGDTSPTTSSAASSPTSSIIRGPSSAGAVLARSSNSLNRVAWLRVLSGGILLRERFRQGWNMFWGQKPMRTVIPGV